MRKIVAKNPFSQLNNVSYSVMLEYLNDIFAKHHAQDGYICFRSGIGNDAKESYLDVNRLTENLILELSRHDYYDTFFSFSTFKKSKRPTHSEEQIQNIFAWSIDVDFVNNKANPQDVYDYIMQNINIPKPSYIECGHRLRLVYIFEEPLRLFPKQKEKLLSGFNFLQRSFCQMINEELSFMNHSFGAEANPACSFFRMPGSINSKDNSIIQIIPISKERYTIQELFDEWVPNIIIDPSKNKKDWYEKWINKKSNSSVPSFNGYLLWERRMKVLEELRTLPSPHRKKMCFFYLNGLLQTKKELTSDELLIQLQLFNNGFINPLSDAVLLRTFKWMLQTKKIYHFTDDYLAYELEVDRNYFVGASRKERDAARYACKKQKKIINGQMKKQKMQQRQIKVMDMINDGMTLSDIATNLNLSLSTIKRDIKQCSLSIKDIYNKKYSFISYGKKIVRSFSELLQSPIIQYNIVTNHNIITNHIINKYNNIARQPIYNDRYKKDDIISPVNNPNNGRANIHPIMLQHKLYLVFKNIKQNFGYAPYFNDGLLSNSS